MANVSVPTFTRVYVWEFPVRLYHWINGFCVLALIITGYIIGSPTTISYSDEAFQQYWFGTVRFVHFVAAYVFFFNFLARIYWGFVGNRFSRWHNFIPLTRGQWKEMGEIVRVDVAQTQTQGEIQLGHNALAGVIYFLSFLVFIFQAFSGFALYSSMSDRWLPRLFSWAVPLMGGDFAVRQWHHMCMWFFIVFSLIHIYLVFYHDYIEGRGTTSSMVGGWKFERTDVLEKNGLPDLPKK